MALDLEQHLELTSIICNTIIYVGLISFILFIYNWFISWRYYSSPPIHCPSPLTPSSCRVEVIDISSSSKLSRSDNKLSSSDKECRNRKSIEGGYCSSSSNLSSSDNECRNRKSIEEGGYCSSSFMYIFVSLYDDAGFALYRINALHHLNNSSHHLNELDPLLFFPNTGAHMEPDFFNCVKFGSKFYFFGLDYYFGTVDLAATSNVYTLEEEDLNAIQPSLDNHIHNFGHLLTTTKNPMHGPKYSPIFFAANQKLFVLSQRKTSKYIFEVFSPSDETWQVLPFPINYPLGELASHVVFKEQQQLVYFGDGEDILSFNLETYEWIAPPHYFDNFDEYDYTSSSHHRTFQCKPVSVIAGMAFGFRRNRSSRISKGYYVCAAQTISGGEELMQPSLAPDQAFLEVLRSSRFAYMNNDRDLYSDRLVALQNLDGKQALCIVTYGSKPPDETTDLPICNRTAYVALSFFDIPGDFYTLKDSPVQEIDVEKDATYADQMDEDGAVVRRHFSAKYRHTTHFIINDSHIFPCGRLVACFF